MNKYESTTIGWVNLENQRKQQMRKKSGNDEIDFPLEEISPAMYRKKKMAERKRKVPPEDGTKNVTKVAELQEKIQISG